MKTLRTFLQEDGSYRYSILAPDFVVDHEDRPHYEKDRFLSMEANLKKGDVFFDVGSELGWQSAIYAQFVGPENVCLFEHVGELWPTIKQIWELNSYELPLLTFQGFISNRTTDSFYSKKSWPPAASWAPLVNFDSWSTIHANTGAKEASIDKLVERSGAIPSVITMDVEGSEYRVLQGAQRTLDEKRPLVWLSIHPRQRLASFNTAKHLILGLMFELGYHWQYLGVDHEEHYFCYPAEREGQVVKVPSPWKTYGKRDVSFEQAIPGWKDADGMPYASSWGAP